MESENETVDDIVNIMRGSIYPVSLCPNLEMRGYADRIEAAHDREIAELRECLREAVNTECNYCRAVRKDGTYGKCEHLRDDGGCDHLRGVKCIIHKWRKALEGANDEGK